jgi:DNA modification methylase
LELLMKDIIAHPSPSADRRIEMRLVAELTPARRHARTHSKKQIRQIAQSIETFGFLNPVLVDPKGRVIAGHGRVMAALLLKLTHVPTLEISHLSETEIRAYVIADNRLAELAGWDKELLALELQDLLTLDLDLDLGVIGFEAAEIDLLVQGLAPEPDPDDELAEPDTAGPPVTRAGDLWRLEKHAILCADAREREAYARLLGRERARMVFTDPPYNVPINGHVSGLGAVRHGEFAYASGEMTAGEFTAFLATSLGAAAGASRDGALHYVFMDWRHIGELLSAAKGLYAAQKNLCVWAKTNAGMGSLYRSQHELVFVFKVGAAPHVNNVELGRHGRYRSNVWSYPGANAFGGTRDDDLAMHPTVKPVALIAEAILDASHRGDVILDPFGGSGSTLIAAERTGRRARLIELEPAYVDVTIRRWQRLTGKTAVHAATGAPFAARLGATPTFLLSQATELR